VSPQTQRAPHDQRAHAEPLPDVESDWMGCMRRGDYEAAWRLSDAVLAARAPDDFNRPWTPYHTRCVWNGTPLPGRRVLIRCYHGLGDTLQFIRYAPVLRTLCPWVGVEAQEELLPLLAGTPGIDALVPLGQADDLPFEVDAESMELPHALRTTRATVPAAVPYLDPGAAPSPLPERRPGDPPRVGLVWAAGGWDTRRTVPPAALRPLLSLPGIEFHSLQQGPARADLSALPGVADSAAPTIEGCAAAMRRLDLIVSVDTMTAHLAGGLGIATWTLLHAEADWRWEAASESCPWYPTMRLFRQGVAGDWATPIKALRAALAAQFPDVG
jgi:hypothetical protein